ncbi:hypothetical protein QJS04_geneDACA015426 [Acorus gramineus]|uniref:Uncharacterized protein n=1 Tax=Acorus gramineus TaxID=55184 RepID=A0AAV9A4T3_ACOGR|nr:hypothetical protein QJS04_geneDACA015426 [Acorus gramineus]
MRSRASQAHGTPAGRTWRSPESPKMPLPGLVLGERLRRLGSGCSSGRRFAIKNHSESIF